MSRGTYAQQPKMQEVSMERLITTSIAETWPLPIIIAWWNNYQASFHLRNNRQRRK